MTNKVMDAFRSVELNEQELERVVGGVAASEAEVAVVGPSSGWFCSISAECNGTGKSCNPWPF